jgi:predicted HAD superfamily phosphohydrolase
MSDAGLLDLAEKSVQLNPCAAVLAVAVALDNLKIPENGNPKITAQVSAVKQILGDLVASVVQKLPAAISPESVAEVIKRVRLIPGGAQPPTP